MNKFEAEELKYPLGHLLYIQAGGDPTRVDLSLSIDILKIIMRNHDCNDSVQRVLDRHTRNIRDGVLRPAR